MTPFPQHKQETIASGVAPTKWICSTNQVKPRPGARKVGVFAAFLCLVSPECIHLMADTCHCRHCEFFLFWIAHSFNQRHTLGLSTLVVQTLFITGTVTLPALRINHCGHWLRSFVVDSTFLTVVSETVNDNMKLSAFSMSESRVSSCASSRKRFLKLAGCLWVGSLNVLQ